MVQTGSVQGSQKMPKNQTEPDCGNPIAHTNTQHPQAKEAERWKGNGTVHTEAKMGKKSSSLVECLVMRLCTWR